MDLRITCIPGDGIGPEIVAEAKKVLEKAGEKYGFTPVFTDILMGGASIDAYGVPLTEEAVRTAKAADAVLMGSIGGNTATSPWYRLPPEKRPEAGLLKIRKELNLFANLRPAFLYRELAGACPLKEEISRAGFDIMIMRELTGGLYFGERRTVVENGVRKAVDTLTYDENEIRRIAVKGFDIAMKRKKKVTSVDKANVLDSSRLRRADNLKIVTVHISHIFHNHKSDAECYGILKDAQIQPRTFLQLVKTIHKRVPVYKKLS